MHATADVCTGGVHVLRGEGGIDRAEPDGQGATLRAGVKADPRNGAELAAQQPGRQPDRPEADDGQGVPPADLGAQQTFVGRAEAAGYAGAVEKGDEVGQHDAVPLLGQDQVGVTAVALPAVRGTLG